MELFALKEATAQNCALALLNEVLLRYGIPRRIHSDNGVQFISSLMQKMAYVLGIKQTFTPVYHPESNPVERKNRDIKTQLAILAGNDHTNWNLNLPSIRFAMNTAKGYSAAYLTFGRELRTPTEVHFDLKAVIQSETFIPQITPFLIRMSKKRVFFFQKLYFNPLLPKRVLYGRICTMPKGHAGTHRQQNFSI